jgi:hypothetical protein
MLLILSKAVESVNFFAIVRVAQSVQFQMLLNLSNATESPLSLLLG